MGNFNPHLALRRVLKPDNRGGQGSYETFDTIENIRWQTRGAPPSPYEESVADVLQQAYGAGASSLAELANAFTKAGLVHPDRKSWTEETVGDELRRLGA